MAVEHIDYSKVGLTPLPRGAKDIAPEDVTKADVERLLKMRDQIEDFRVLMMKYDCALSEVRTKLDVLNKELALRNKRNPFEAIKMRIKTPESIYNKLNSKGIDITIDNIRENLSDIAGIRVICSFVDDIYMLANCLAQQDDIRVLQKKDYISSPKRSGYRSLHLIIEIPIFLTQEKEYMKVEVQFRTIAMDFWATLEHKMKYKKDIENAEVITEDLKFSADLINQIDMRMQQIREKIDASDMTPLVDPLPDIKEVLKDMPQEFIPEPSRKGPEPSYLSPEPPSKNPEPARLSPEPPRKGFLRGRKKTK
ncbi:MAG: GTP pyrophosphokinase family protein [Lachnospiraceae bacterium]|nr:GTP pyrophosphokinase family protein [Lachnospiraceae bacterium]